MAQQHIPVLLAESIEQLCIQVQGTYLDMTYGCGGHSQAILRALGRQGRLFVMDRDPQAQKIAQQQHGHDKRFYFSLLCFSQLYKLALNQRLWSQLDGILIDCGVSSSQLDEPERGFSFLKTGPLDMRMNPTQGVSAAQWLAQTDEKTLANVLWQYGEERHAKRIAHAIVRVRARKAITQTQQLADIIYRATPRPDPYKHPATRTFQALRIVINNELEEIRSALDQSLDLLKSKGRLVVTSFHSLEDRLIKNFIRRQSTTNSVLKQLPLTDQQLQQQQTLHLRRVGKAIRASDAEVRVNPRSRSAILRVAEKC